MALKLSMYEVRAWGGGTVTVKAESSDKAKRIVCHILGRTVSNPVTGIRGMKARNQRRKSIRIKSGRG